MKKRVLIYGMNYSPELAGVGPYTGDIGSYLASLGHIVSVVTTKPHYPGWTPLQGVSKRLWSREIDQGAKVFRCPVYLHKQMYGFRRFLAPVSFALASAPVVMWQIFVQRPNIVIVVEPTLLAAPVAIAVSKIVGAKTVLHIQDFEIEAAFAMGHLQAAAILTKPAFWFNRFFTRRFDRIITIANAMAERVFALGIASDRVSVVRNWVDLRKVFPLGNNLEYRAELGLDKTGFIVLYSGSVGLKQGMRLIIEGARHLAWHPTVCFVVAGEGPMREEVESAAETLPNLRVIGFQPADRFAEFLAIADLLILPQERNVADLVLPSKLGGMLASGRPVLVTADAGTELSTFLGTSCVITPPGDVSALSSAILNLAQSPANDETQQARLNLARQLSKTESLARFAEFALFMDIDQLKTSSSDPVEPFQ